MLPQTLTTYFLVFLGCLYIFIGTDTDNNTSKFILTTDFIYLENMFISKLKLIMSVDVESNFYKIDVNNPSTISTFLLYLLFLLKNIVLSLHTMLIWAFSRFIRIEGNLIKKILKTFAFSLMLYSLILVLIYSKPISDLINGLILSI
jgi:hypothetical protein